MHDSKFSTWIENETGVSYEEYDYDTPTFGRSECWIESKQGENFIICFKCIVPPTHHVQTTIVLDGVYMSGSLLYPRSTHVSKRSGNPIGSGLELAYTFGKQVLTDDESIAPRNDPRLAEMNTIRVVVKYCNLIGLTDNPPAIPNSLGAVHERAAKKAHGDMAGLGAPKPSAVGSWCQTQPLPELGRSEFVFHYAPLAWLKAHDIIPKPRAQVIANDRLADVNIKPKLGEGSTSAHKVPGKRAHKDESEAADSDDSDLVVLSDLARPPPGYKNKKRPRTENKQAKPKATPPARSLKAGDVIDLASDSD